MCPPSAKITCKQLSCPNSYARSVACMRKADRWNQETNGDIQPYQVQSGSNNRYAWNCASCGHLVWLTPLDFDRRDNCKHCSTSKTLCGSPDCEQCFNNSLASTPYAALLVDMQGETYNPLTISKSCNRYVHCKCINCGHLTKRTVNQLTLANGCIYCNGNRLCGSETCTVCVSRSFINHPQVKYWDHSKNTRKPHEVALKSNDKFFFICPDCNQLYHASLDKISSGRWCDCVKKKTELKLFQWLQQNGFDVIRQKRLESIPLKPLDFCIESLKIIIELDGLQHFEQRSHWQSPETTTKIDCFKMLKALRAGYTIIRLRQIEVWNNSDEWSDRLLAQLHSSERSRIIYIDSANYYHQHRTVMKNMTLLYRWKYGDRTSTDTKTLHNICQQLKFIDDVCILQPDAVDKIVNQIKNTFDMDGDIDVMSSFLADILLLDVTITVQENCTITINGVSMFDEL